MNTMIQITVTPTAQPQDARELVQLQDELIQLDVETFEIEDLPDLEQHAAKSCTSTSSTTSSTSSCSSPLPK
jgi:thiazolylpeptide-type bacteriocin precursor